MTAEIDAIEKRLREGDYRLVQVPEIHALLAAIAERDATIKRLTEEAVLWAAQADARDADIIALESEVARLTAERDTALRRGFDVARVMEWLDTPDRKPADLAFTEGPERQAAYLCETAALRERDAATATERERIAAWMKQRADDQEDRGDDVALRLAAAAIARGEHGGGNDA